MYNSVSFARFTEAQEYILSSCASWKTERENGHYPDLWPTTSAVTDLGSQTTTSVAIGPEQ